MRIVIVGPPAERARLRASITTPMEVVGEAPTLEAARRFDCDAFLIAAETEAPVWERELEGGHEPLTPREIQVIELLAQGLPNKAIAARLAISDQTVKFHVSSICGKLGAMNRTDAVRLAVRRGLIAL
jgi:DNA-binding NarL/FixJ family response regulator